MSKRQVKRSNKKLKLERSTEILGQIEQLLVVENSKSNLIILYLRQSIRFCFYVFVVNVQRRGNGSQIDHNSNYSCYVDFRD